MQKLTIIFRHSQPTKFQLAKLATFLQYSIQEEVSSAEARIKSKRNAKITEYDFSVLKAPSIQ